MTFDVVVVGGGSAGCAVAARLSEDGSRSVLLLEAGPDWRAADAPPAVHARRYGPSVDFERLAPFHWTNRTVRLREHGEPRMYYGGRGLGGSSTINTQIALRPPLDEFDHWRELGAHGWSSELAETLFSRVEDDRDFGDRAGHGRGGPIAVERPKPELWTAFDVAFRDAAVGLGFPWRDDVNGTSDDVVSAVPYARAGDRRVTTNHGYLEPARGRRNLTIVGEAFVDRVVLDRAGTRAVGVRWARDGVWTESSCGEVVLSAGSIGSPSILLRSGIGPADDLAGLGVRVHADLPVGIGAQDHPDVGLVLDWEEADGGRDRHPAACLLRATTGVGPGRPGDVVLVPLHPAHVRGETFPACVAVWLFEVESRGALRLRSLDPYDAPAITLGFFSERDDVLRLREGLRLAIDLTAQPPFDALGCREVTVGSGVHPRRGSTLSDEELEAIAVAAAGTHASLASTCRMGRAGDATTVVDPAGRVVGIEALRVADLSIAPKCPRANANLTAIVIGERIAELIRAEA